MALPMFILMFVSIQFYTTTAQTTYVVGDALGWTIPTGGVNSYTTWASLQFFTVRDILIFNFTTGKDDVAEVSKGEYNSCTFTNPATVVNGPASITLTTTGNHYYICTLANHCKKGQKLAINVYPADNTIPDVKTPITPQTPAVLPIPPSPTPYPPTLSPRPNPTTPPTITSGNNTPPPPPPPPPPPTSGAPSFTTMAPASFFTVGFTFLELLYL